MKGGFLGNNPRNPKLLINTYYKVSKSKLAIRHNYGLIKTHYNTGGLRDNTKHSYTWLCERTPRGTHVGMRSELCVPIYCEASIESFTNML